MRSLSWPFAQSQARQALNLSYPYRQIFSLSLICILLLLTACQPASSDLPTLAELPTDAATEISVTSTQEAVQSQETPFSTPSLVPSATPTLTPTETHTLTPTETPQPIILIGTAVLVTPSLLAPSATPTLLPEAFQFGHTAQGTPLNAYRYGTGNKMILLVGGTHTGFEANTVRLMEELQDHYTRNPAGIVQQVSLVMIPVLNADGLQYGQQLRGRFNGNTVDLNRNWACGWSETAVFRDQSVDPGSGPFSEPESMALGALIQQIQPSVVIFYHAAANGIFPGNCEGFVSDPLAAVYSAASGYPYSSDFGDYAVTGSASGWVDSQRIPAIDVELATSTETEILENLRGIDAVQLWLAAQP